MNKSEADEFREAFLSANANREFIAGQVAEVIRCLMRAISSEQDTGYNASEQMNFVFQLLQRCDPPLGWHELFSDAITEFRENLPDSSYDKKHIQVAMRGIKYIVESSATDNAATGRASRRQNEFRNAIRHLETAQAELREVPSIAQRQAWATMDKNAENVG